MCSAYTWAASRLFSGGIEESLRLRFLGMATFWLVAASLAWVGGSPWTWIGGGRLGKGWRPGDRPEKRPRHLRPDDSGR